LLSRIHNTVIPKEKTMTTATASNQQAPRKQLSDQLDRLDTILDALSEGLNGAGADAAREGTRQALKDAIIEIMTDPTLRARLHEASAPPAPVPAEPAPLPTKPSLWARLKAKAGQALATVGRTASQLVEGATRTVQMVTDMAAQGVRALQGLGSLKTLALVGLGVGVAVGVASFLTPHAVAVAVSGVCGAVAAAAVQIGVWTRRAFRAIAMA
jgi:hypothetical protein